MATTAGKQSKTEPKNPPKPGTQAEPIAAPPGKKRRVLKLLLLLVLLLGAGGGGAWYFLLDEPAAAPLKPGAAKATPAKAVSSKPPVFVPLEPFTVNLTPDDDPPQYLQVGLSLKLNGAEFADTIKLRMPEIRNRVLLLLSSKKARELNTLEGKKALSLELSREIGQPLAGSVPAGGLDSVLFTSFVIQ